MTICWYSIGLQLACNNEGRYNAAMNEQRYWPDPNRVGVLTSTVLLAFALTRLIQAPEFNLEIQLPGFFFTLPLNISTAMSLLTAGLTATGMDWLLRGHPSLRNQRTLQWWLLPTLTTFVISVPKFFGPQHMLPVKRPSSYLYNDWIHKNGLG